MAEPSLPADLTPRLAVHGLIPIGVAPLTPDERASLGDEPEAASHAVLVGNTGSAMWEAFMADGQPDPDPHPLDRWTKRVVDPIATSIGARALYPFAGPPYAPFVRWALRSGAVTQSVLGLLIHPEYGLWHAYRAALVLPGEATASPPAPSPCATCADRPCLGGCPVSAYTHDGESGAFDVDACRTYLRVHDQGPCMTAGCLARRSCPVGAAYRYEPPHAAFHMRAFR